jgi:steroid 5-alpha reductase family enzyme
MDFSLIAFGFCAVAAIMVGGWLYQVVKNDAGIVDVLWTLSLGGLGIFYAIMGSAHIERKLILVSLVGIWSLRLASYIFLDRVLGKKEDSRYKYLREHWGKKSNRNFFWFFQAQGIAALYFSLPFLLISFNTNPGISTFEIFAIIWWIVCIAGEWIADTQLKNFRSAPENKGKTCNVGLWKYSRHPNYFFEWLHWLTYVWMLFGTNEVYIALSCPVVMLYSLLRVSGIPHTEAQAIRSRGDSYRRYQEQTSMFIPWFQKGKVC